MRCPRPVHWFHTAPGAPRQTAGRQASWRRVLPVALVGLLFATMIVASRIGLPDELDPTAPFIVGHRWGLHEELAERGVPVAGADQLSRTGYDGQWFLGQASDPLLLTDIPLTFDAPRYRSLRVLMPAGGWLLAAGQPAAIPYGLLAVSILATALGCAACARIAAGYRRSPWWGATFALIPGVWVGLGFGTAEPLAVALAALGISLALERRYLWAGVAFAGTALTKETYLAFAVGAAVWLAVDGWARGRRWVRPALAVAVPGAASLFAWWAYVELALPPDNNPHGALSRFSPPFVGWVETTVTIVQGDYPGNYPVTDAGGPIMMVTFAMLAAAVGLALWLRQSLLAYLGFGWALFGSIIAAFLLERYLSAQRALAPAVLAAGLLLITARIRARRGEPAGPDAEPATDQQPSLAGSGEA